MPAAVEDVAAFGPLAMTAAPSKCFQHVPDVDLADLYRGIAPSLVSFCTRILSSDAAAKDAAHEAFARVMAHRPAFSSQQDFCRYMYRVAFNICLNERRRRRPVLQEDLPQWEPEARIGEAEIIEHLFAHRLLAACDPRTRHAATLCLVEGYGCEQTAAMLGCSRRSVYNWLRDLKSLAAALREGAWVRPEDRHAVVRSRGAEGKAPRAAGYESG